jgi:hypothetical protein
MPIFDKSECLLLETLLQGSNDKTMISYYRDFIHRACGRSLPLLKSIMMKTKEMEWDVGWLLRLYEDQKNELGMIYILNHFEVTEDDVNEALCGSIFHGMNDLFDLCIKHLKVDVRCKRNYPIRHSARYGRRKMFFVLIEKCPDVDIHAERNYAYHWAKKNKHREIVDYLKDHGAMEFEYFCYNVVDVYYSEWRYTKNGPNLVDEGSLNGVFLDTRVVVM